MKDDSSHVDRKNSINEFKTSLADFIVDAYNGKPFIFIIDELDRCRPNYAVSILEQIKHFFCEKRMDGGIILLSS